MFDSPRSFSGSYFDDEAAALAMADLEHCDAMLMGRTTCDYFAAAWPAATGPLADRVNGIAKYAFSSTLVEPQWINTSVITGDVVNATAELKRQSGGNLMNYGVGRLSHVLLEHDLVDELKPHRLPSHRRHRHAPVPAREVATDAADLGPDTSEPHRGAHLRRPTRGRACVLDQRERRR